jgi:O-antigen/teichoic acid export membrane protein
MFSAAQYMIDTLGRIFRRSGAQHAGTLAAADCISTGLAIITTVISARLLGPNDYGQAAIILAYPSLLLSLASFKSITVTTRYCASFHGADQKDKLGAICKVGYAIDFGAFVLPLLAVMLTGWWVIDRIYELPINMFWLMAIYAASFLFLSFRGTSFAVLTAFEEFRLLALLSILDRGMTLILAVPLLAAGFGVPGMIMGMAAGNLLTGLVNLRTATALLSRHGIGAWWRASFESIQPFRHELFSFFGWNYLMVTLGGLLIQVPLMLLGNLRGPEEAGFYRLALSLKNMSANPQNAARRVIYPRLSARWSSGEYEGLDRVLKRWTLHWGVSVGGLQLLLLPLLPTIVPMVLGDGYQLMVRGAQMMVAASAVSTMFFWLPSVYYASGKIDLWTKAYGLYSALIIGFAWVCIQRWGFFGLAGLVALGEVLFAISAVGIFIAARGNLYRKASSTLVETR